MRVLIASCVALLTACSSNPPLTTQVVTVDRPIPVRCVKAEDIPAFPSPPLIAEDADIEQRAAWAAIRDAQLRHYAAQLRAVLTACATGES